MSAGYFGKLPARADFVTRGCPAGFLKVWEPFLIGGIARSRLDLKDAWQKAYMTMPIWRFWLSSLGSGGTFEGCATGAFMPCVDKVGREFPLTVVTQLVSNRAGSIAPEKWYCDIEAVLLKTLEDGEDLSGFQGAVSGLVAPEASARHVTTQRSAKLAHRPDECHNLQSGFWCAVAGSQFAFECAGLPHAEEFQWLLLPENHPVAGTQSAAAGSNHGRFQSEDQRT